MACRQAGGMPSWLREVMPSFLCRRWHSVVVAAYHRRQISCSWA